MTPFHQTMMGRKFFDNDVVEIKQNIERIAQSLIEANNLKERELSLKERELALKERELIIQNAQLQQNKP